jgi:hypothetical protein
VTVAGRAVADEIRRLGASTLVTFGELAPAVADGLGGSVDVVTPDQVGDLEPVQRVAPPAGTVVLAERGDLAASPALATVQAAGLPVVAVVGGDPRGADSRAALATLQPTQVLAVGRHGVFPAPDSLAGLVRTAVGGVELPGGGQVMFPGRRLVALYGHPGDDNLGVLGEQPVDASVGRAHQYAAAYNGISPEPPIPTFEIITTVASADAGGDGDYSAESSLEHIRPWVEAAAASGIYVVLDLQPGYTDFLTQAKRYEELLVQPHVGLALDPEWRLAPGQRHLRDIGSVSAAEVNATAAWLAGLVRDRGLPQKLFLVHQFRLDMIGDRDQIVVAPELAMMFQMDGLGSQDQKLDTWTAVTAGGPAGAWFGWKNFHDEDSPMRSPADTVALTPSPLYISYQ